MNAVRRRGALFIASVYMPTDSNSASVIDVSYEKIKEDVLMLRL